MIFSRNGHEPGFDRLERIHRLFGSAQQRLEKEIGVPICVPDCGKCCEKNCVAIRGVEAHYIAQWVRRQKPETQKSITDICSSWLLAKDEQLSVYRGMGTAALSTDDLDQVRVEGGFIMGGGSHCPMLTEDKKCLIHPVRPLLCRAFGVTRIAGPEICDRPLGKYETKERRAYLNNEIVDEIKRELEGLKSELSEGNYYENGMFLATALYAELEPQSFVSIIYHNLVPTAKLLQFSGPALLYQEQLSEIFNDNQELGVLVHPMG